MSLSPRKLFPLPTNLQLVGARYRFCIAPTSFKDAGCRIGEANFEKIKFILHA